MAKKKVSQQEKLSKEVLERQKSQEAMVDSSEKLASLKSLNNLLVKETVERREQVSMLLRSKEDLEAEITRFTIENQRWEADKKLFDDQRIAAEVEKSSSEVFFSLQLNQLEEKLKNEFQMEKDELKALAAASDAKLEQKIKDEETRRKEAEKMKNKFQRENEELKALAAVSEAKLEQKIKDEEMRRKEVEELNQQAEMLKNQFLKENEELKALAAVSEAQLEQKIKDEEMRRKEAEMLKNQFQRENEELKALAADSEAELEQKIKDEEMRRKEAEELNQQTEKMKNQFQRENAELKALAAVSEAKLEQKIKELNQQVEKLKNQFQRDNEELKSLVATSEAKLEQKIKGEEMRRKEVEELNQQAEMLKNQFLKENEELKALAAVSEAQLEQKIKDEEMRRKQAEELNQQEEMLKNQFQRENEELKVLAAVSEAKLEEKIKDEKRKRKVVEAKMMQQKQELDQVYNNFSNYRVGALKDLDLKQIEVDQLRSMLIALEKSNAKSQEEAERMQAELDEVVEVKADAERRFEDLKIEMVNAVKERNAIEQVRINQNHMIDSLKKSVEDLTADLIREGNDSHSVLLEKDLIQVDLLNQIKESDNLKSKLLDLEKSGLEIQEELQKLQLEHNELLDEKKESGRALGLLEMHKASMERSLMESSQLIEVLQQQIRETVTSKEDVEREKIKQEVKNTELQKEVDQLRSILSCLREEEEGLRKKVSELGESYDKSLEKQEQLLMEFNVLVEEKKEGERCFEQLMEEKTLTERSLAELQQQLDDQTRKVQETVQQKAEMEQLKITQEMEIAQLHKEVDNHRGIVSTLQESCDNHIEMNNKLQSEAIHLRDTLESVYLERGEVQKDLDKVRKKEANLISEVLALQKCIEETHEELGRLKTERDGLLEAKKEMENHLELLAEDKASFERGLTEAQDGLKELRSKVKCAGLLSGQILFMLKRTAAEVCRVEAEEKNENGDETLEDIEPIEAELEAIKRAFKNRETKVEDMTRQLEILKNSMMEAQKKRSMWAWVSSASTIFAAASVAYVTRGH